jgi:hypothetical protein
MEDNKQDKIAHLGFIQNIINRLSTNSFLIKSFTVTQVSALLAFLADSKYSYISIIPILLFWWLDAFFLYKEKLYRNLYNEIAQNREISNNFSLDLNENYDKASQIIKLAINNKILCLFYGTLLGITILVKFLYC